MARYISEESLKQKLESLLSYQEDYELLEELIAECRELNPWMTLDEFLKSGFEGDCRIYLRIGYDGIGKFNNNTFSYRYGVIEHESITHVQPIHKPEPPQDD